MLEQPMGRRKGLWKCKHDTGLQNLERHDVIFIPSNYLISYRSFLAIFRLYFAFMLRIHYSA